MPRVSRERERVAIRAFKEEEFRVLGERGRSGKRKRKKGVGRPKLEFRLFCFYIFSFFIYTILCICFFFSFFLFTTFTNLINSRKRKIF